MPVGVLALGGRGGPGVPVLEGAARPYGPVWCARLLLEHLCERLDAARVEHAPGLRLEQRERLPALQASR